MSPYISGFLIFLIISLFLGAFLCYLRTDDLRLDDRSLDKQSLFWFSIVSPIVLFLIFGLIIWKDYVPELSAAGLTKFYDISKFPLAILALSPIFGVIITNIHKTMQTESQIKKAEIQINETKAKNITDSYFSHIKYVTEEFKKIEITEPVKNIPSIFFEDVKYNWLTHKTKIDNEDKKDITISLRVENPNKLYRYIYEKSNIKDGFINTINDDFTLKLKLFLKKHKSISGNFRKYLITDNVGNPFQFKKISFNMNEIKITEAFLNNFSTINEVIPNFELKQDKLKPTMLHDHLYAYINPGKMNYSDKKEKEHHELFICFVLEKYYEYYGVTLKNIINFIDQIIDIIQINDNELHSLIQETQKNADRIISVAKFMSSYIKKEKKNLCHKYP
ncbi:hypothetical protein ABN335_15245 [Providencia rettgeri]